MPKPTLNRGSRWVVLEIKYMLPVTPSRAWTRIRADFREGDEDSNFSIFRVRHFSEWPEPLHWIAFPVEILTKPLIQWIASPLLTDWKTLFCSLKSASSHPLPKNRLLKENPVWGVKQAGFVILRFPLFCSVWGSQDIQMLGRTARKVSLSHPFLCAPNASKN